MRVQTFRGPTADAARQLAVAALGEDIVVCTSRTIKRQGLLGLLGMSEVELAVTPKEPEVKRTKEPARAEAKRPFATAVYRPEVQKEPGDNLALIRSELRGELRLLRAAMAKPTTRVSEMATEIAALRDQLDHLVTQAPATKKDKVQDRLRALGLEGPVLARLARALRSKAQTPEEVRDAIADQLHVSRFPISAGDKSLVAVVGPTGVGKTTTLAKLAAIASLHHGKSVAFIMTDTFRVGATEQLARYAEFFQAHYEVARTPADLAKAVERATADVILIDTCGRTSIDKDGVEASLASLDKAGYRKDVLLCLPAAVRAADAQRVGRAFSMASPTALAITKIDETTVPSGIVHATVATDLPIALSCNGPMIPDDIAPATVARLLDYVLTQETRSAS